ncbi:hypothetical protein C8Q76DRAFT_696430 [Earliella scabrosa]|nr:hypothetical protein C8Q76DRAFT_696430 [Earliella scabrosa]
MAKPATRPKSRYGLFSVGRNKASPARTASTRRASVRRSVIRGEATQLDFECAGDADGSRSKLESTPEYVDRDASTREIYPPSGDGIVVEMKHSQPPPTSTDAAQHQKANEFAPPPREAGPPRPQKMAAPVRHSGPSRPPQHSATMPQPRTPAQQSNIFRRFTSKFRSSSPTQAPQVAGEPSPRNGPPQRKHTILRMPAMPKAPAPANTQNDFTNAEQRQAALRARGLIPASPPPNRRFRDAEGFMMPLSEQEAEIDRRYTVVPGRLSNDDNGESEATKIREAWLAKQTEAASSSTSVNAEEQPRRSDAMERASKDGTIGERSPVRATFVHATTLSPKVGEIGEGSPPDSPYATVEEFHTAPNTPAVFDEILRQSVDRARPLSPLRNSSALSGAPVGTNQTESPWSRSSTDLPTPVPRGSTSAPSDPMRSEAPLAVQNVTTPVAVSPAGTLRTRKDKPPPIIVTSHRPSQDVKPQVVAIEVAGDPDSDANVSEPRLSHEQRGRPTGVPATIPPPLAQNSSTSSSENGHESTHRPRRSNAEQKAKGPTSGAAAVIIEEYSETEPSSEGGEFGKATPVNPSQSLQDAATPGPPRTQVVDQSAAKQNNRKSFSLFGKKSLDIPRETRTASSMANLRRAFTSGTKPRPKSTLDLIPAAGQSTLDPEAGRKRSKMFDASHLPASPTFPPAASSNWPSNGHQRRDSTGVGLRPPRQAVAPTMHSHGSILLQAHTIEDEESRRLSEMAFLT